MFTRHISQWIAAHLDGQLAPRESERIDRHLLECPRCRSERAQIEFAMARVETLPLVQAPPEIWASIEAALVSRQTRGVPRLRWALAAMVVCAILGAAYWRLARPAEARWVVVRIDGAPSVGAKPIRRAAQAGPGEWIETDARSRATVQIGEIGSVEIEPNSYVEVLTTRAREHRLALKRGRIQAKISAPPKFFLVDTASGTAVDLGCEYSLSMGEDGFGLLSVTKGWVSFEWKGRESLVPAGASCRTRPHAGPGMPYFDDAPESLKEAVDGFGAEKLAGILAAARVRDTLTLWHLLARVDEADRGRVYDRIAALTPVPAGVSRDLAIRLDRATLKRWRGELAWTW